ncbi:c-type cytochrome [Phenylobacterium deserti]|uniref:Cytochrome C n=1 Tax=Phenylobacterium deserti TaxID=1914756 RepID=A0A328ATJ7_9CAUL|nr:cytochrome c [Phenylobacterium deserti]RAK56824.1 cytochrome C [Phenylobacterium deserti]
MRMTSAVLATVCLTAVALSGCATLGAAGASADADAAAVARGRVFAQRACSGCHAIDAAGQSPNPSSPAFPQVARRFTEPSLRHRLQLISRNGHYEMPPIYITPAEISDVAAYIRTIKAQGG